MNAQTTTLERQATEIMPPLTSRGEVVPFAKQDAPKTYPPKMAKAILNVTREIGAIEKNGWNDFHKYKYQKWDDILDRLSILLPHHGLIITPSEVARSLFENEQLMSITYEFIIVNEDGDVWPERPRLTAIARARDSKGTPDDKAAAKAHTQAEKYFLIHFFKIRTSGETPDSDADGAQVEQRTAAKPPKPGSAEAQKMDGPRPIDYRGMSYEQFVDTYLSLIGTAQSSTVIDEWVVANKDALAKLEVGNPQQHTRRITETAKLYAKLGLPAVTPKPPKPPRPGAAPVVETIPDPKTDGPGWIAWLTAKLATFDSYEAGETFWNDRVQALDLPNDTQEDAMGCWRRFEERFSP